jgi:hypothetical protein
MPPRNRYQAGARYVNLTSVAALAPHTHEVCGLGQVFFTGIVLDLTQGCFNQVAADFNRQIPRSDLLDLQK